VIGHIVDVEMVDKVPPLCLLGLELGMFTETIAHSADDAPLEAMRRGRARGLAG
jgi:hypothetical protein